MLKVPALWGCRDPEIGGYLKGDRFYRHLVTLRLVTLRWILIVLDDIASMRRRHRFYQHDPAFLFYNGTMHFPFGIMECGNHLP